LVQQVKITYDTYRQLSERQVVHRAIRECINLDIPEIFKAYYQPKNDFEIRGGLAIISIPYFPDKDLERKFFYKGLYLSKLPKSLKGSTLLPQTNPYIIVVKEREKIYTIKIC